MGLPMSNIHTPTLPTHSSTPSASSDLQTLSTRKSDIEAELSALSDVLESHNVTMQTPLLTADGFPRADIDVAQIRTTRARIVRLRNDYKAVLAQIEPLVHAHFAALNASGSAATTLPPSSSTSAPVNGAGSATADGVAEGVQKTPFARVASISPASPASDAGLQVDDRVVQFGDADWLNHEKLARVARIVGASEGRSLPVSVLRDGNEVRLELMPRRWGGRGLLGCHLLPL